MAKSCPILSVISNSTFGNSPTPNRKHNPRCGAIQQSRSTMRIRKGVKKRLFAYLQKAPPVVTAGYEGNVRHRPEA
jgi:hypothetical protein